MKEEKGRFYQPLWIVFFLVLGLLFLFVSQRLGNQLTFAEILYELGIIIIAISFLDLFLMPRLIRLANLKSSTEKWIDEIEIIFERLKQETEKIKESIVKEQISSIYKNTNYIESSLNSIEKELRQIRARVDPTFAEILHTAEKLNDQKRSKVE